MNTEEKALQMAKDLAIQQLQEVIEIKKKVTGIVRKGHHSLEDCRRTEYEHRNHETDLNQGYKHEKVCANFRKVAGRT